MYLFLTPSKTNARVLSHQGSHTTCNLTQSEVSQQTYVRTLETGLGVVLGKNSDLQWGGGGQKKGCRPRAKFTPLVGKGGWEGEKRLTSQQQEPITLMAAILDIKSPSDTLICLFSQRHFPSKDILFPPHLPASRNLPNRSIGCPWRELSCDLFRAIVLSEQFMPKVLL